MCVFVCVCLRQDILCVRAFDFRFSQKEKATENEEKELRLEKERKTYIVSAIEFPMKNETNDHTTPASHSISTELHIVHILCGRIYYFTRKSKMREKKCSANMRR